LFPTLRRIDRFEDLQTAAAASHAPAPLVQPVGAD
jgi:hypothetical protein